MAELQFPDIAGRFQKGQAFGTQQRVQREGEERQSRLAGLAQQAYAANPADRGALIGEAVGVDPTAGFALGQSLGSEEDRREKLLLNTARLIDSAPPEQKGAIFQSAYPQISQHLPGLPPVYNEQVGQGIKAFIQSRVAADQTRNAVVSPGSAIVNPATGGVLYERPFAPANAQTLDIDIGGTPTQVTFNPRTQRYERAVIDGVSAGTPGAPGQQGFQVIDVGNGEPPIDPRGVQAAAMAPGTDVTAPVSRPWTANTPDPYGGNRAIPQPQATPLVGRRKEDEAAAVTAAQEQTKLGFLPEQERIKTAAAIEQARGTEEAKTGVESAAKLRSALPDLQSAQEALQDALTGFKDGTYTSGVIVGNIPKQFQSPENQYLLTTINDNILATAERMKGTLSDKDVSFLQSATFNLNNQPGANVKIIERKLKIINDAIDRAQGGENKSPRNVTTQAQYDALPSGAVYLEDGVQYRKP